MTRLANLHDIAFFTDGLPAYRKLFPQVFGRPYRPARQGTRSRHPKLRCHIPRTAAHAQIVKHRQGRRLTAIDVRYVHGSIKRIDCALAVRGYATANTSAIERCNGTARLMGAAQVRKSLAFSDRTDTKQALDWRAVTVYNRCRSHRSLRRLLPQPVGKKA